jgi:hypothetical protein
MWPAHAGQCGKHDGPPVQHSGSRIDTQQPYHGAARTVAIIHVVFWLARPSAISVELFQTKAISPPIVPSKNQETEGEENVDTSSESRAHGILARDTMFVIHNDWPGFTA